MPSNTPKEETEFLEAIRYGDVEEVRAVAEDPVKSLTISQNWSFVKKCAKEVVGTRNFNLLK